jgi:hypothetical protein
VHIACFDSSMAYSFHRSVRFCLNNVKGLF